jgi:hypothetical protein
MRKMKWCALLLAASTAFAQAGATGESKTTTHKTTATKKTTTHKTTAPPAATTEDIQALRTMIEQQNQAMQEMRQQLQQRDAQMQQLQQSVQEAQTKAASAESAATEQKTAVTALQSDVTDVKGNFTQTALSTQEDQKRVGALESPAALHYKGITITPGGFIEAAGVIRNRNENASVNSASGDGNIPFPGSPNGTLSEFRFDARQSRVSLKAEGKIGPVKATGYYEVDFLGAAPTANENQSNSFNLRQRQLWAQAAFANGFTITGGQQWSLFTLNRKAMENGGEFLPMTINAQYVIGYDWARQPGFRFMKNFHNKVWLGFAVENSSMVLSAQQFGAGAPALVTTAAPANNITLAGIPLYGFNGSANAISPNGNFTLANTPGANGVSTNLAPDLVAKLTFEPGWGHFEIKGMARFFRDRYAGNNNETTGGGLGLAAILPLVKSKVDFFSEFSFGNGMGRYGSGGGFDVTLKPDGTLRPIRSYHGLFGPELHIGKNIDIYAYYGGEYYQRTAYLTTATSGIGYGLPFATNTSCKLQQTTSTALAGACNGNTRYAWEFTPGFVYRFYKGTAGTVQMGVQYSYSQRALWSGIGGLAAGTPGVGPTANVSQVYTNLRYVLP